MGLWIGPWEGVILGAKTGCTIVTNGDFAERHGPVPKLLWANLFYCQIQQKIIGIKKDVHSFTNLIKSTNAQTVSESKKVILE